MPVQLQEATLDNGLKIIAEVDPNAHTAAAGFFVKTGARDEASKVMGVSHFLEHMMFKGTDRRSADDVNREFDELGASYNAFTTTEMTAFHAHVLPELFPKAVDLLADILRPSLRQEDFDTEKNVILEEIAMYKDNPFWVLYEEVIARHYREHGLGYRVLGLDQTIVDLKRDQMEEYFTQRYSADNTVLAAAGRIDFDALVTQAKEACGAWNTTGATRDTSQPAVGADDFEVQDESVSRCYNLAIASAPALEDERRYAAMMLTKALGDPDNSRLHWALIEPGIAEEAEVHYDAHDGSGDFLIYASCAPERADDVWSIIGRELDGVVDSIGEGDLARLRNKLATFSTLSGERPNGRMQRLGRLWSYLGSYMSLEEELDRINAVKLQDIRAVYEAYPFSPRTYGRLSPKS